MEEVVEAIESLEQQAVTSITGFSTDDLSEEQIQQIIQNLDEGKIH